MQLLDIASASRRMWLYKMSLLSVISAAEALQPMKSLAVAWLAKAAEQGNHNAQSNLAFLYRLGRGVPHDLNRAYMWRLLSLQGTDTRQNAELRDLAATMSKSDIAEAESRASGWLQSHKRNEPRAIEPTFVMLH